MIGEEEDGFLFEIGWGGQDGMVAGGMETEDDFGFGGFFHAQPLGSDGQAAIAADFYIGAHAPDIGPPRTAGCGAPDGTFFFSGLIPGPLRCLAQFTMDFMSIAMRTEGVDLRVGHLDFQNLFAGEAGRQPPLPVWMLALDFALGLGRGRVAQADGVELERPAQLSQSVWIVREKEAVIIHVKLQRAAVRQESGGQKIKAGKQKLALVKLGAGQEAAAIIKQVEHGESDFGMREPAVRRGVELPGFADLGPLPAAHRSQDAFGRDRMSHPVFDGPASNLGAVEFAGRQAQGFGSSEAVGARRRAGSSFFKEVNDRLRPGSGMVAPPEEPGVQRCACFRARAML